MKFQALAAMFLLSPVGALQRADRGLAAQKDRSIQAMATWLEVEAEDRHFYNKQLDGLEVQLLQLQAIADPQKAAAAEKAPEHLKMPKLNLNPRSAAELAPALAMLKGLYEDGKQRIAQLNTREQESKQRYEAKKREHEARMAAIEARKANHSLSAEFCANETRDENRIWNYWERVRERQHHQFHTSLNIQHGTMTKVKAMIDMYEKAMSGDAGSEEIRKKLQGGSLMLLQQVQHTVLSYCADALVTVKKAQAELRNSLKDILKGGN